jgi:hypothetical protein
MLLCYAGTSDVMHFSQIILESKKYLTSLVATMEYFRISNGISSGKTTGCINRYHM